MPLLTDATGSHALSTPISYSASYRLAGTRWKYVGEKYTYCAYSSKTVSSIQLLSHTRDKRNQLYRGACPRAYLLQLQQ